MEVRSLPLLPKYDWSLLDLHPFSGADLSLVSMALGKSFQVSGQRGQQLWLVPQLPFGKSGRDAPQYEDGVVGMNSRHFLNRSMYSLPARILASQRKGPNSPSRAENV